MNKTLLIVLIVVGSVGLLATLTCAGCGLWAFKALSTDMPAARGAADAFLVDLKSGDVGAAYSKTSRGFQSAQTSERFRDLVERVSMFTTHTSRTFDGGRVYQGTDGTKATFKVTLHSANDAMPCTLTLVREDGQWKVQQMNIP
jgi:hypothetical protein